jgi:hypothetical protein
MKTTVGERSLWAYGVVAGGGEPPAAAGVDGHPVRVQEHGGVAALVSAVPADAFTKEALSARLEDLAQLEALARAHEAVLDGALGTGAVVPFRLCTIYSSPQRLDAMLEREAPVLRAALERLHGMQEWGVKAFVRPRAGAASAPAASGTEYLLRKRERRDAAETEREALEDAVAEVHARLTERAVAAALSRPQDRRLSGRETEMILNGAYLVPADAAEAFRQIVEAESGAIDLELTGPWPPYHFVEEPIHHGDA